MYIYNIYIHTYIHVCTYVYVVYVVYIHVYYVTIYGKIGHNAACVDVAKRLI